MPTPSTSPVRVLVVDDEAAVLDAYRRVFASMRDGTNKMAIAGLRQKLFASMQGSPAPAGPARASKTFDAVFCTGAETAVQVVRDSIAKDDPFNVAFIDMRMPPGPDGAWAAARIRAIDPLVEIVICTAYSDVDPRAIGAGVEHGSELLFLHKPFHPHEVLQLAAALSEKRLAAASYIDPPANRDAITGLADRASFMDRLSERLQSARRQGTLLAVLDINLDGFRRVNTSLGSTSGDGLLRVIGQRLTQNGGKTCARLGADGFAVLLADIASRDVARDVASRIIEALAQAVRLGGQDVLVTASVGIATFEGGESDAGTLLRNAEIALRRAKAQGRGKLVFFEDAMDQSIVRRFSMENHLHGALERDEFSLVYQPQVALRDGLTCGMEVLLRWENPLLGKVSPAKFIPLAEETGMILPLGEWVLRTACRQLQQWREAGLTSARIAVNVSGRQFAQRDFPVVVAGILSETGLAAELLEIELTESVLMKADVLTQQVMGELRTLGLTLAIDDFGTEYSSLSRLASFPINRLKVDQSFVCNMTRSASGAAMVRAIIQMAKALGLTVVAEGVEEPEQLLLLQEQGCDEAQGYLLGRPQPAAETRKLLEGLVAGTVCGSANGPTALAGSTAVGKPR